jgi:hypothetical protein
MKYHDRAVHSRNDVVRDHHATGCAVVDKDAGFRRLEANRCLLSGGNQREARSAEGTGHRVKVDVVALNVSRTSFPTLDTRDEVAPASGVGNCELHVVTLVHDDDRCGNAAHVREGIDLRSQLVDDQFSFLGL